VILDRLNVIIPPDLAEKMKLYPEIRWDEVVKQSISNYLDKLSFLDRLTADSELTAADAEEIGELIKSRAWEKLKRKAETGDV